MATQTRTGIVKQSTACHDGGYLVVVAIDHPKRQVAVRSTRTIPEGQRIAITGEGRNWGLAA